MIQGPQGMTQGGMYAGYDEDTLKSIFAQQQAKEQNQTAVGINVDGEFIVAARMTVPALKKEEVPRYQELLTKGIMEQVRKRIPKAMKVKQNSDGTFDVKCEFALIRLDEFKKLMGGK